MKTTINLGYIIFLSVVAALGGFLFGYDTAVISGTIAQVTHLFQLDTLQQGWYVGCALIGSIVGVLFSGILSDSIGRKRTMILSAILFSTSAIGCAFCIDFNQLVVYSISSLHFRSFRRTIQRQNGLPVSTGRNCRFSRSLSCQLPVIGIFREWKPLAYSLVRKNSSCRSVERYVRHGDTTSHTILYYYLFHTRKPQMADSKRTRKEGHLYSGKDLQFIQRS